MPLESCLEIAPEESASIHEASIMSEPGPETESLPPPAAVEAEPVMSDDLDWFGSKTSRKAGKKDRKIFR